MALKFSYPTVSCLREIGITWSLLVSPTVGLMPSTELKLAGHKIDPPVSVPSDTVTKLAAVDIADPLLEPHGLADKTYGFCKDTNSIVNKPSPLHGQ